MIKIIGDTTSGLTFDQAQANGIELIPQYVIFGEETFRDDTEIDSLTFVKKLRAATELPKTAAPAPALYEEIFKTMTADDQAIILCPSAKVSGTVRGATNARAEYPQLDIRIIDTEMVGGVLATLLIEAKRIADSGGTIDAIETRICEMLPKQRMYAVVETLEFLHKGGRIGGASKLMGDILQIKPILSLIDGSVQSLEKQRTTKKAFMRIGELLEADIANGGIMPGSFSICALPDRADLPRIIAGFGAILGESDIPIYNIPPGIMVHAGPDTVIFCYFRA